ncbi:MAG: hypothetical protein HDR26_04065 [Lachnospiraceae bacterium]|nr:hypothetical protein [Lachnospiraceae bacterium]
MLTYFKMKKAEWKLKAALYGTVLSFINQKRGILDLLRNMYTALKDVPADKLQQELIAKFAEMIHEENKDKETHSPLSA